jgi:hypothetical protein
MLEIHLHPVTEAQPIHRPARFGVIIIYRVHELWAGQVHFSAILA